MHVEKFYNTPRSRQTHSPLLTYMYTCVFTNTSGSRAQRDVLGGSYVRTYRNGALRSLHTGQTAVRGQSHARAKMLALLR